MAFDQNSIPKDLRPLSLARAVTEEPRIAPVAALGRNLEGFYGTPTSGNPAVIPVLFPATDAGFVGMGVGNVGPPTQGWFPRVQVGVPGVCPSGYGYTPNLTVRVSGGSGDQASDEGADDSSSSSSGRKVKFLCSFGGKILPRPSDGVLRYVGGQTRIISVRRDVSFNELVQKMIDIYGQSLVIKYQLPDEELDALVSVSCRDDLENMMEEYEKLLENSHDGSAKLRVFLFSASEFDTAGLVQYGDLNDNGQKYVDAVNGIADGAGGCIARKESIASAASTQNSDLSGTEGVESSSGLSHGDVVVTQSMGMSSSPKGFLVTSHDPSPRLVSVDPNPNAYPEGTSSVPLGIPMVNCGSPQGLSTSPLFESSPRPPYVQAYMEPHMGFPGTPLLGAQAPNVGTVYPQQQSISSHQFTPSMRMIMNPTSPHVALQPIQPMVQPRQTRLESYPEEGSYGTRVVQVPIDQGYAYQAPVSPAMVGGYGWPQQQVIYPEKFLRSENCFMCQKQLPHAHSDTLVQDQRESVTSPVADMNSVYHSLCLDENTRPRQVNRIMVTGALPEGVAGHIDPQGVMSPSYDMLVSNIPRSIPEDLAQQLSGPAQYIVKPEVAESSEMPTNTIEESLETRLPEPYEVAPQPVSGKAGPYPCATIDRMASEEIFFGNPAFSGVDATCITASLFPPKVDQSSNLNGKNVAIQDTTTSLLFGNQGPWSRQHDSHFPPPKPSKIMTKKDSVSPRDPFSENHLGNRGDLFNAAGFSDGVVQHSSGNSEHAHSAKGSAEEIIKQELQAVAEDVAARALQSPVPSNSDLSISESNNHVYEANQEVELQSMDQVMQYKTTTTEDIKTKLPETTNFGFPVSDGIGRLQIIKNSDLEELQELGSGTFGTVYHGKWRGTDVAIKRINERCFMGKASEQERLRDDFWNEAIKLADLHHPNVVAFYGVVLDGLGGSVATVTEYMVNGSLRNALQKNERSLDKRKRLLIAMDAAFGMEYLHGKNIVHFDLKSDNLLVNLRDPHRPICKVGDLGLSKVKCNTLISGGVRGTLPWMAPELLNGSSSLVSEKVDVFSFGIVLWELLTGEEPYADLHYGAIIGGIVSNTLRPAVPESCDEEWRSLMERCWSSEPTERPNFTQIANQLRSMASKIPVKSGPPQ